MPQNPDRPDDAMDGRVIPRCRGAGLPDVVNARHGDADEPYGIVEDVAANRVEARNCVAEFARRKTCYVLEETLCDGIKKDRLALRHD